MLNKEERKFIEENFDKLSLEEISNQLGIRLKKLKKEIKRLNLKSSENPSQPSPLQHKGVSISSKNRKKIIGAALFIFLLTFLVYANALKNDFIWDDEYLILKNSQIKSFSHFWNVFRTYVGYGSENINNFYRPLQELSNMIDYFLWDRDPMGFHLTNILLHGLVASLVFIFIFYLCNNIPIAFISGIFFGVHPIHTEAVTYIAGRADSLYSAFFLLSFICFIRYVNHVIKADKRSVLLLLSNIFFICALLSKEIGLILPLLLVLYIYVLLKHTVRTSIYNRLKNLWVPYAVTVSIYAFLRFTVLNFFKIAPSTALAAIPFPNRIFTFFKIVIVYIKLLIFPTGLHMERTISVTRSLVDPVSFLSFLIVLGILGIGIVSYKRGARLLSFFIFWFFINLLPVANIFPINSFIAEHWLYMASIGCFFVASSLVYRIYTKTQRNLAAKTLIILIIITLLISYSFLTVRRNQDWKDEITFFENTLLYSPDNARLYLNFGNTYYEKGRPDKAIEQYKKVISIQKDSVEAYTNIGAICNARKNFREAEKYLKEAVAVNFNFPVAHYNLGVVYYNTGRTKEAISELEVCIKQLPQHYPALNLLGRIYLNQGNKKKAALLFQKSLKVMPNQTHIKNLLERALR